MKVAGHQVRAQLAKPKTLSRGLPVRNGIGELYPAENGACMENSYRPWNMNRLQPSRPWSTGELAQPLLVKAVYE